MKKIIFLLLFSIPFYGQMGAVKEIDSVAYYIKLADFYKSKNNYKSSLVSSNEAIKFASKTNNPLSKSLAYTSLGTSFFELKKIADAKEAFLKSIAELNKEPLSSNLALNYYKLGLCYMSLEDYQKAETFFNKAQEIYDTLKIENQELITLQKGIVYRTKGKTKEATELFNSIISKPDNQDYYESKAEALYQLARIELGNNRNNLALNYLERALEKNTADKNIEQRIKILHSLSVANDRVLNTKKAYVYLKEHVKLRDSLLKLNNDRLDPNEYYTLKENERTDLFEELIKENEVQQKSNRFAKVIVILAIALITILSLLSLSLYKNNIIRTKTNKLLQEKNSELEIAKEKAEKASQARADFLSTVSHELRTPLNAINGITHLLIEEDPKDSQKHYLNSLKFSGNYLLTFINEILEINRIESNNIEVEKIDFNLKDLLFNIQNSLKELAKVNNNDFILDIDPKVPDAIVSDPTKLSQIFINLINNALKFTKNGEVKVVVELFGIKDNQATIHFEIIDTGIGIAIEKQESIFDSFSQGSIEINRKYGGTGLGLAIVKKLMDLLGGTIKLQSELGKGTTFYFDLEIEISSKKIEQEKEIELEIPLDISDEILEGKNVLIVEDNKINQMITKKMVEKKGMITTIIDNGEDAVEAIRGKHNYDLVLMDVHLPGINGTIATKEIRKFNKELSIIALTAISLNENRDILLSFGMNDVITKPFDPVNFYNVIAKVLSKSKSTV
ncbi:MAG: hybrid sensor histidine kinase/response regulator [Flavobacteriaceae bacterium]|nr:MAG: hybrid sensor histidine kinase/response regulator [Flavobacteriaceae bacterium]